MLAASNFLASKWPKLKVKGAATAAPLSYSDCSLMDQCLSVDAMDIAYSALVSVADAIRGIEAGFCSWATVKLYYSVFYALRALLALNKIAFFYVHSSPFWILNQPGERPVPGRSSSSHKVVFSVFEHRFSSSYLLSQTIDFTSPLVWLQNQRENVNYKQAKFYEPHTPPLFQAIAGQGSIRKVIAAYFKDDSYAFDPDHAILAYPITVLKQLKGRKPAILFSPDDKAALQRLIADAHGRIASFDAIILGI